MNNYHLIKSNRQSLGISIKPCGTVIIRVPHKTKEDTIVQFINKHQSWIDKKLITLNNALSERSISDTLIYYLGQQYPVNFTSANLDGLQFSEKEIWLDVKFRDKVKMMVSKWYKSEAIRIVMPILNNYSREFKLLYKKVKFTDAVTRWGSCNSLGTICFSLRIVMLPIDVITYIIVHELAHLKHLNHSQQFWQQVEKMLPEYKLATFWLKDHKYSLANHIT